ncbi:hypothetical protein [Aureispira sp. CCB-E]|uniref:hypothetical protein n=1 Tax=Aureispira sp. CCB-E TaxID=3051121 RepID=UPI0028691CA8|nr:hypothetical protein [Aureispira sp. CCB-E]WMX15215.1 hypothetical protein QP953_02375 [Aureispira sp. CCB-E]
MDKNIDTELHQTLVDYAHDLCQEGALTDAVSLISKLAYLEGRDYIGYLSSIRLEVLLLKIAQKTFPNSNFKKKEKKERKVLHIGTEFYNIGGHTKVVLDWIENDIYSNSEILLTNQQQQVLLPEGIPKHYLKGTSEIDKAVMLRDFLYKNYFDVIVLHQHMEDIVPTLALWDIRKKTGSIVLFYNHANFRFSLGNIIADKRINFNSGDVVISKKYRYPVNDYVLNFVLGEKKYKKPSSEVLIKYRQETGLEESKVIFFAIGSPYKYAPFEEQNFFAEWNQFLSKNHHCTLIVVGSTEDDFRRFCPNLKKVDNLLLKGRVTKPIVYYQISDYIVDTYPLPAGLGTLDGLYYGLPPILSYQENSVLLGKAVNKLYPDTIVNYLSYTNKQEYFEFIEEEIETKAYKKWASPIIEKHIEDKFLLKPWQEQLEKIYAEPCKPIAPFDTTKDILNKSIPSQKWYKFTASPTRSFNLIILAFKHNIPFSFKLLAMYICLIIKNKSLKRAGLRTFVSYLLGRYKRDNVKNG